MQIDADPEVLRVIMQSVVQYCENQLDILRNYYSCMISLKDDVESNAYLAILERIQEATKAFEAHLPEVELFLIWLNQKIVLLEEMKSARQMVGDISDVAYAKVPEVTRATAATVLPMTPCPDYKVNFDTSCFENGKYQTGRLDQPIRVYRYFGSYQEIAMREIECRKAAASPDGKKDKPHEEWGSDVGGRWFTTLRSHSSEHVMQQTALKEIWGNSAEYVA
jgi:hypothetical protein